MPGPTACRLCSRSFVQREHGGRHKYCKRCRDKVEREIAKVLTIKCKECGKEFSTSNRHICYCSDPCRRAADKRHSQHDPCRPHAPPRKGPATCRMCGKEFTVVKRPGKPIVYCSEECRTGGLRRQLREARRRYLADPERRAIAAARSRADTARRLAGKAGRRSAASAPASAAQN